MNLNFSRTLLCISSNLITNINRSLKKRTFPYRPRLKDLRINPITKVVDRDLTPENSEFLNKLVENLNSTNTNDLSPLKETPWAKGEWFPGVKRSGVIAKKIGQFPQWLKNGTKVYVTLLQVHDNHVINYQPPDVLAQSHSCKDYWKGKFGSLVVGTQTSDPRMFSPAYNGLFEPSGLTSAPKAKLTRFIVSPQAAIQPGTPLNVNHFKVGHYVDCEAKTIEHGFQGVMKRWGFKGGPAAHGNTKSHRRPGSFGGGKRGDRKSPGTVHKGTKMAGLMGGRRRCTRGLRIWRINTKHNVMYIHGFAVPGPINSFVKVFDTRIYLKSPRQKEDAPPFPTFYPEDANTNLPEEIIHPDLFDFDDSSINFKS
ncbi:unnamed protein product [Gordionus sp. m RMFG-2023]|uniref:large ribosomal subunit protein uL3m-like n=1 Tax=Gordionus sp. m RMFG-2023 TaxID=3053472 RepID=UPI0030E5EEC9